MALIQIPPALRRHVGGERSLEVDGRTMGEVLRRMCQRHPLAEGQIFNEEGGLNRYVNVYLNQEDIRVLDELETPTAGGDTVVILPAMVERLLDRDEAGQIGEPEEVGEPWLREESAPEVVAEVDVRVRAVNDALIHALATEPALLRSLRPRQFEELMAELYAREGFEVELTPPTRDGGVDLYLIRYTSFGRLLTVVDTKRHRADRPVGVGLVRQLYGVVAEKRANAGVVATTSFFSRDAKRYQESIGVRLALQDYDDLRRLLRRGIAPATGCPQDDAPVPRLYPSDA